MRLLLILCLILASAALGPPAGAQAPHHAADHHSQMAHGDHGTASQDGEQGSGKASAVAHVCPGCAVVGLTTLTDSEPVPRALPRLPANPAALISFATNPIPPPPRSA